MYDNTIPVHAGKKTVSPTSGEDIRSPLFKGSMETHIAYEKTVDEANRLRDTARRVKAWEIEMERTRKANARTMRQRARGYY